MKTVTGFIQSVLIDEIRKIQQEDGHHYLSFSLIAQGIEFLGACLDDKEFDCRERGINGKRFRKVIRDLFPTDYLPYNDGDTENDLYKNLRNWMIHQGRPNPRIGLTHQAESERYGTIHLRKCGERLTLVSERLFGDFDAAAGKVVEKIDKGILTHEKLKKPFLYVPGEKYRIYSESHGGSNTHTDTSGAP